MLNKILKIVIPLFLAMIFLTGCWDDSSIEDKNILSTVIVDYVDNKYLFLVEIFNIKSLKENKENSKPKISTLQGSGETLIETRYDLNRRSDHELFLGAVKIVVFTKTFAQIGIEEYINRMRTDFTYRKSVNLAITQNEPKKLLMDIPENSATIGDAIDSTLKKEAKLGNSFLTNIGDVLEIIAIKKVGFLIPEINTEEEEPTLTGYGVFKDAKYIGAISSKDSKGIVYFLNSKPSFFYTINYNDKKIIINSKLLDRKIKSNLINNEVSFDISMKFESEINYMDKHSHIKDEEIKEIEAVLENKIKDDIIKAIELSQKTYKCDYLNFYKYFRAENRFYFKSANWDEIYSNAKMNITIKAPINKKKNLELETNK
jgi:spore germination protein KC